jgi:two-component system, chemotaxis family, chemotaxis protein CheY
MKALVVDDSRVIRTIIGKAVLSIGFEALQAENGQEALAVLNKSAQEIQLVILDWNMPVLNGFETLRALRNNKDYDHIRVIMVSTESESKNIEMALTTGANGYLTKPFTPEALTEKIRETLEKQ